MSLSTLKSNAQKVKYKDLFQLLEAKKYDQAEPFLRTFLAAPKNAGHPNAHLQMGKIYQARFYADSAITHYKKARSLLDEKEVRKNDVYYQAYLRRDLRTGKIGIKVSDVTFDLEKKVEVLEERKIKLVEAKSLLLEADSMYSRANASFVRLQQTFGDIDLLLLHADDSILNILDRIGQEHRDAMGSLSKFQKASKGLTPQQSWKVFEEVDISDFREEGIEKGNFYDNQVKVWRYGHWSDQVGKTIREEIAPAKAVLINYHHRISDLENKTKSDSALFTDEIKRLEEELTRSTILRYDSVSLPIRIMNYRLAQIFYYGTYLENERMRDSLNAVLQVNMAKGDLLAVQLMDSLMATIKSHEMTELKAYSSFMKEAYGNSPDWRSWIVEKNKLIRSLMERHLADLDRREMESRWMIHENDSIPLFLVEEWYLDSGRVYHPLLLEDEFYTSGLVVDGSPAKGYFSFINVSRRSPNVAYFEVSDSLDVKAIKMVPAFEKDSLGCYLLTCYPQMQDGKWTGLFTKFSEEGSLLWRKEMQLEGEPDTLMVSSEGAEVTVTYQVNSEEENPTLLTIDLSIDLQN